MASKTPALDHFGRLMMTRVRDEALDDWELMFRGRMRGRTARDVVDVLSSLDHRQRQALAFVVPAIVDTVIDHVLWLFEQEESVRIRVSTEVYEANDLAAESDGLCGEVFGPDGWIARFSKYPAEWAGIDQKVLDKDP